MKPTKGYYSLIQYCPDLSRLEAANIGVLLFCPDRLFLQARTTRDNRRIRHIFGREGHDWSQINSFKIGLEERLEVERPNIQNLDDLQRFIELRANQIQITTPRPMRVRNPDEDLAQLFQDLVGGAQRKHGHGTSVGGIMKYICEYCGCELHVESADESETVIHVCRCHVERVDQLENDLHWLRASLG